MWCICVCAQSCLTLCHPMDCSQPGSSVHGILQARILEWVSIFFSRGSSWPRDWTHDSWVSCFAGRFLITMPPGTPTPGDLPNSGIKPRSPALQAESLPAEPPGKPKNTGVGSLSLLQKIFQTQELNQGLLHYRQILYQLSYQGSPYIFIGNK